MFKNFKSFLMRGNVVDLAIAVVVGAAFTTVVNALVRDLVTPLIAAIGGKPDFSAFSFEINHSRFLYGDFLNAIVSFLVVTAAIYFMIVAPMSALNERLKRGEPSPDPTTKSCPECLSQVPIAARRCAFCTSVLPQTPSVKSTGAVP